jgi:glycosyltransferase involved in cell wall biosynthesis
MASYKEEIGIIIPALNPRANMVDLVGKLREHGFQTIILVDDGSLIENRVYFKTCKEKYNCRIIRHVVNFGKGMALKSAFNFLLQDYPFLKGAVTVDCDGQHCVEDIITCAKLTHENPDHLILGCRQFDDKSIPLRSRFGNKFTRLTIGLLCGIKVSDTQTGLRGMSRTLIKDYFASTKGERFEYEMNMLLEAKEHMIPIKEFTIQTIYLEKNESSHFNPFLDSIRIYKVFLKFSLSSFSSFLIDICIFYLYTRGMRNVLPEVVVIYSGHFIAKAISSIYNYTINKNKVFRNQEKSWRLLLRYYTLWLCQTILSAVLLVKVFAMVRFSVTALRICIETCIYFISFQIQREWVFKKKKHKQ